jgi:hypothetical protein
MKDFFQRYRKSAWFLLGFVAIAVLAAHYPLHPRVLAVIWAILLTGGSGWFLASRNRQDNLFWPCLFASFGLFALAVANMASVGYSPLISAIALISGWVAARNLFELPFVDSSQRPLMLYRAGFALVCLCAAIADLL